MPRTYKNFIRKCYVVCQRIKWNMRIGWTLHDTSTFLIPSVSDGYLTVHYWKNKDGKIRAVGSIVNTITNKINRERVRISPISPNFQRYLRTDWIEHRWNNRKRELLGGPANDIP